MTKDQDGTGQWGPWLERDCFHGPMAVYRGERYHLLVENVRIPGVMAIRDGEDSLYLKIDGRFLEGPFTVDEVARFVRVIGLTSATAAGWTHIGPEAQPSNPYRTVVRRLDAVPTELRPARVLDSGDVDGQDVPDQEVPDA